MGVYLSKPITDKISTDEEDDKIKIGASSMQGWRESQEDAHNSILDFDVENTYYFAVYDGHGGREIALYCSKYLPKFIRNTEAYKNNDMAKALIDGFLGFDATLISEEVQKELKALVNDDDEVDDVSDEENVNKLYEEATMPLDEVIEKYKLINTVPLLKDGARRIPLSPFLRGCKTGSVNKEVSEPSNSDSVSKLNSIESSAGCSIKEGDTTNKNVNKNDITEEKAGTTVEETKIDASESNNEPQSSKVNSSSSSSSDKDSDESKVKSETIKEIKNTEVQDGDKKATENSDSKTQEKSTLDKEETAGTVPQENGKISKKGKALAKTKGIVKIEKNLRPKRTAKQLYRELLESESESESEDEADKSYQDPFDDSSSEEDVTNIALEVSDSSEEDENLDESDENDCEEMEEEEEENDDEMDNDIDLNREELGYNSGCTAVVALIRGTQLFVANAGDSRCIICRNGTAVDLSIDHKPEDTEELNRIKKAGGYVCFDGRVKGNLNLSRAIGDHSYKLNKELPDREQMITALPDIQTYTLTPSDEFMVLACDGIWNSMSSQEVADFVKTRLEKQPDKLSQICEELFENCLASDTMSDGSGCDNMTAIIINFKDGLFKRAASDDAGETINPKRVKTDDKVVQEETTCKQD